MIENQKKRENVEIKAILHKSPSNRWFKNGMHSLLSRADARGSADTNRQHEISLLCRSRIVIDVKSRSLREYLIPTDYIIVLDYFFNLTKKSNLIGRL